MSRKVGLGVDVLTAAEGRISTIFDLCGKVYLSFSGGKDSTVMLHLVAKEARKRNRRFGLLLVDLEAQYAHTINHAIECFEMYSDVIDPYWVSLPLSLRNAVSQFEPQWLCFDPDRRDDWVRDPPAFAITDESHFPFFRRGMEFEDFIEKFSEWYSGGALTACFVGIRSDESLNRFRTLVIDKQRLSGLQWTTRVSSGTYNAYPIYDWHTKDIWTYTHRTGLPMNPIYHLMHQAGVPLSHQRICQPYGDDQRRGLWLYHLLEPQTWGRVIKRVMGANSGALYSQESGNINGVGKVTKPSHLSWEQYAKLLLGSMPPATKDHYENKIAVFLKWYEDRGYPRGIPDDGKANDRDTPSWTRIVKALLRNDYWCKGLSFSQHKSGAYAKYQKVMKARRAKWGLI
ncbi:DUF3440 domain-containing protein [Pusillimonas noertemannii]|uniref:DUF3440 domain-containing protein n=1 Tax=Pusillimonas noertemannii TaxID=305977 RepID=UPI003341D1A2